MKWSEPTPYNHNPRWQKTLSFADKNPKDCQIQLAFVHSRNVKRRKIPASATFSTKLASSTVSPASARARRIPRGKLTKKKIIDKKKNRVACNHRLKNVSRHLPMQSICMVLNVFHALYDGYVHCFALWIARVTAGDCHDWGKIIDLSLVST